MVSGIRYHIVSYEIYHIVCILASVIAPMLRERTRILQCEQATGPGI